MLREYLGRSEGLVEIVVTLLLSLLTKPPDPASEVQGLGLSVSGARLGASAFGWSVGLSKQSLGEPYVAKESGNTLLTGLR